MNGKIEALPTISHIPHTGNKLPIQSPDAEQHKFATVLKSALNQVSNAERESNLKTQALATGKLEDLHDVMITAQKASITVETAVQVQQKVIDIYSEMMRMQV